MSNRYILGLERTPQWEDASARTGRKLRRKFKWLGPNKLFIKQGIPLFEIKNFFQDGVKPDDFWKIGILSDSNDPTDDYIEHPTMKELVRWWIKK